MAEGGSAALAAQAPAEEEVDLLVVVRCARDERCATAHHACVTSMDAASGGIARGCEAQRTPKRFNAENGSECVVQSSHPRKLFPPPCEPEPENTCALVQVVHIVAKHQRLISIEYDVLSV